MGTVRIVKFMSPYAFTSPAEKCILPGNQRNIAKTDKSARHSASSFNGTRPIARLLILTELLQQIHKSPAFS
jgi:hypothetical protein